MARNTYGGTVYDVAVNASNPAQLALSADGALPLYNASGGAQTDFKLWNTSTSAFDITATSVSVTGGYLPLFQGPDATELYTDAGAAHRLPHFDNLGASSGTVSTVNHVTPTAGDIELTQDDIPDGSTHKQFTAAEKTFVDSAPDTSNFTAAVLASLADPSIQASLRATVKNYLSANSYYPSFYIGASDPLPSTVIEGATVDILSGSATTPLTVSSFMAESRTGATSVTTAGTPTVLGAGAVVLAFVTSSLSTGTSGSPAPTPTGFTGMGLTWSAVTLPVTHTFNGYDSAALYLGTGTGTNVKPTATFASAPDNVHIRIVQVANANGVVAQATATAYSVSSGTPNINLPATVQSASATIGWIVQNNATNTQTPGTGYTELASALSSTGMRTSGAYAMPSRQAMSWTTPTSPSGYQKLLVLVEVS